MYGRDQEESIRFARYLASHSSSHSIIAGFALIQLPSCYPFFLRWSLRVHFAFLKGLSVDAAASVHTYVRNLRRSKSFGCSSCISSIVTLHASHGCDFQLNLVRILSAFSRSWTRLLLTPSPFECHAHQDVYIESLAWRPLIRLMKLCSRTFGGCAVIQNVGSILTMAHAFITTLLSIPRRALLIVVALSDSMRIQTLLDQE